VERFLSRHVPHEGLSRPWSCIPHATPVASLLDELRGRW
jgi:hypothetical protein